MRKRLHSALAWGIAASLLTGSTVIVTARAESASPPRRLARPSSQAPREVSAATRRIARDASTVLRFDIHLREVYTLPGGPHQVVVRNASDQPALAYGALVTRRDRDARPRKVRAYVVRPAHGLAPYTFRPIAIPVGGLPPEFEVHTTFVLFEDGTWAGDEALVTREIASLREELAAARDIAMRLQAIGPAPSRAALIAVSGALARGLARATGRGARDAYAAVLRTLGVALDEVGAGRTYGDAVAVARDIVDRRIARYGSLPFLAPMVPRA